MGHPLGWVGHSGRSTPTPARSQAAWPQEMSSHHSGHLPVLLGLLNTRGLETVLSTIPRTVSLNTKKGQKRVDSFVYYIDSEHFIRMNVNLCPEGLLLAVCLPASRVPAVNGCSQAYGVQRAEPSPSRE